MNQALITALCPQSISSSLSQPVQCHFFFTIDNLLFRSFFKQVHVLQLIFFLELNSSNANRTLLFLRDIICRESQEISSFCLKDDILVFGYYANMNQCIFILQFCGCYGPLSTFLIIPCFVANSSFAKRICSASQTMTICSSLLE